MKIKKIIVLLITLACLIAASGCASTQTDSSGVTIEKRRSGGLLNFIPFL
jgi:ABC-type glycerol-3-phosphate transport system substrate-binding protein